jgi:hypothetical protein
VYTVAFKERGFEALYFRYSSFEKREIGRERFVELLPIAAVAIARLQIGK